MLHFVSGYTHCLHYWCDECKQGIILLSFLLPLRSVVLSFTHVTVFAVNGWGVWWLEMLGNLGNKMADCLFMLFLLLLAKGWAITNTEISGKVALWTVWGIYVALNVSLFIWGLVGVLTL